MRTLPLTRPGHAFCLLLAVCMQTLLDDQCVKAASMRASPLIGPLAGAASAWAATLDALQDLLDAWVACQARLCDSPCAARTPPCFHAQQCRPRQKTVGSMEPA